MGFNLGGLGDMLGKLQGSGGQGAGGLGGLSEMLNKLPLGELLQKLPLDQLLNSEFLQQHTPFKSAAEMLQKFGIGGTNANDLQNVPPQELDEKVNANTKFGSMQELLQKGLEFMQQRQGK
ncbi:MULTISPECIES: hypothetical protein [Saccharibacillus]|uniref:Uncharacterized protein n=1 Tax=Saccharibacillus brassicae TaxID=2583377 RepID=A0A4Y6V493_SACBS|nr:MULTISPECIES: hypothetical protein [Saccharibacillus]MWJ30436.1 hypothetical protein [Saccharibacillus sp. WB 17]QDH23327.1 hypothetical protein FFV09_22135 [Saccharibacillus brassicae]